MDQFVSLHGQKDHALLLDCRSLTFKSLAIPDSVKLVISNTMVKHELASSEYNRRRADCEEAVRRLATVLPGIRALRDVSLEQLERHRGVLSEVIYKRALHIVTENARVLDSAEALEAGDIVRFGKRMAESHRSLRDLYEVSCRELDLMVDLAYQQKGRVWCAHDRWRIRRRDHQPCGRAARRGIQGEVGEGVPARDGVGASDLYLQTCGGCRRGGNGYCSDL